MAGNHNAHQAYRAMELTPLPECELTKAQMLDILMLLSGIESWSFADKHQMPAYLQEQLDNTVDILRTEVLK